MTAYHAIRHPQHKGPAAWSAILGPQPAPRVLDGDETAEVVIVGAGFAGLSAARRLRQLVPEARIVVLEAGRVAEGAAGRNSGFMIDLPHELTADDYAGTGDDKAQIVLNRQAIAFGREAAQQYDIAPDYFDPAGKVNGAVSPAAVAHNRSYAEHLAGLDEPYELLDAQQMAELTGSRAYQSGLYTPGTVILQPAGYIRGLATGLVRDGVAIFENAPVTGFEPEGTGWSVQTPRGRVRTDKVILTVNGHLESFGVAPGRLMHIILYASMTPDLPQDVLHSLGGASRWGVTPSDPMGTTMRRIDTAQGGNRIITRTCATYRPGMAASDGGMARAARVMRRKFEHRFPKLKHIKMEHVWAGHLCLSRNNVAMMREIDRGVFSGCVQNGLGTVRGTLTGMGAAELAAGVTSEITRHFTAEAPPRPLPPKPVRSLGINAVLRWREWKARME